MRTKQSLWTVPSGGRTIHPFRPEVWMEKDFPVGHWTRESLERLRIKPKAAGDEPHQLVVIPGSELGPARNRRTEAIHREGVRRRLLRPSPDTALLFREAFPVEAREYRQIVFMHKPIRDRDQHPSLLCWEKLRGKADRHRLVLLEAYPGTIWPRDAVFVFRVPPDDRFADLPRVRVGYIPPYPPTARHPRPSWTV